MATFALNDKSMVRDHLEAAIREGRIWPAFQPFVEIQTGKIVGFEILARWDDPERGAISPAEFIPILEETGLIDILFEELLTTACRNACRWPGQFTLAFNISPKQLTCDKLPSRVNAIVSPTGFPIERIEIEVTEGSLIIDDDQAYRTLEAFHGLGVRVAIDDLGTGYSSLARLEAFPFDKLKIDARFVRSIDKESGRRRIATAIIGLGQSLGITVVAEGVETPEEERALRDLGCNLGQGWLFGKGEAAAIAEQKIRDGGCGNPLARPLDLSPFQQLNQLSTLYNQAPVGLAFLDLDFRHVRSNDRFAGIHGMSAMELEGKTIGDIMFGKVLETVRNGLNLAASRDEPVVLNFLAQGREIFCFNSRVKDPGGEVIGFSVVMVDHLSQHWPRSNTSSLDVMPRALQETRGTGNRPAMPAEP
ncbi:MAG: EAL domain-containing protein [Rhizobium sp.]